MLKYLAIIIIIIILIDYFILSKTKSNKKTQYSEYKIQTDYAEKEEPKENIIIPMYGEYEKRTYLLTKAENNFYNVLKLAIENDKYIICPKVRLADFIVTKKTKNWQANFNRINRKHIDFLICDKYMKPIYGIELDDKSHENQTKRDDFVEDLYVAINFPLIRIKADYDYSVNELKEKIKETKNINKNVVNTNQAAAAISSEI